MGVLEIKNYTKVYGEGKKACDNVNLTVENEIEVIKQGAALAVYLFPNMFLTMGLCVAAVALCFVTSGTYVLLMQIALYSLLCGIFYLLVNKEK